MSDLTTTYGADPVPWVTDLWSDALDGRLDATNRARAALAALDSLVGGLGDDEKPYSVRFVEGLTANTQMTTKVVTIGHAPLADASLTKGQVAAIMTGLMFHEVGHIRHTRKVAHILDTYGAKGSREYQRALKVLNLADDVRAEGLNSVEFPGLSETLPITLRWVGERTIKPGFKARSITTAFGLGIMAVRYPTFCDWTGREAARDWWQAWGERAAVAHTIPALRAVMDEALDRIASDADMADEPTEGGDPDESEPTDEVEPTEGGDGSKGETGDDDTDEGDEPTEGGSSTDADADDEGDDATEGGEQGSDDPWADDDAEGDDATEGGDGEPTGADKPGIAPESAPDGDAKGGDDGEADDEPPVDAESLAPECPTDAAKDGREEVIQHDVDARVSVTRDAQGKRTYTVEHPYYPGGRHAFEVTRSVPSRRGIAKPDGEVMGFLPPTVGMRMEPERTNTQRPTLRVGVSMALAGAIAASKRGDPMPTPGQRSGRLDRQRLSRVASGDCRVFTNVVIPGPARIRAIVLLDASGSMEKRHGEHGLGPTRATVAAQVGMDLAGAFDRMPNVKAAVYAHNMNHGVTVHALWQSGEPTEYVGDYADLQLDSNEDALAIRYCTDDLTDARRPGESLVLVVVSDGKPMDVGMVRSAVDDARKRGVAVVSVAIAPEANDAQVIMYGHDDVVPFEDQPLVMARKIAQAIGRRV